MPQLELLLRGEQEGELAAAEPGIWTMDEAGIARFVSFYERITRHILAEMPARADLTARLDPARRVLSR